MKPIITGFFDHQGSISFDEQLNIIQRHQMNQVCLRYYNQKPLIECSDKELKEIYNKTKDKRIKIAAIDTLIKSYDINNDLEAKEAFDAFKHLVKVAQKLKISYLFVRLPKFHDVIEEFENIKLRLEPWVQLCAKQNKKMILVLEEPYKANTYAYIIKKMKSNYLKVLYDPVYFLEIHQSNTTSYRILKKHIQAFACRDADQKLNPKLIGYGKTDIIALLKKLIRDRYSNFLLMDNEFYEKVFAPQEEKAGFFKKLFSKTKKRDQKQIENISKKIFPNEQTKNATYDDILDNQLNVIQLIFKK